MNHTYRLLGGPGSPYSLKMRAILRYRQIAHRWIVPRGYLGTGGELQEAGKRIIPVLQYPDGSYWADSTPLAYALEARHPDQRSIIPTEPGLAFLSHLIEDMADEFLVMAMFDMRWGSAADQDFCARRQLSGWLSPMPTPAFNAAVDKFIQRQVDNRAKWVQADNQLLLADFYARLLPVIEAMLGERLFLFGSRPSLADFGLYGQLSQCAIDPTASALMRAQAPRTFQWTQTVDDLSGIDGDWAPCDAPNPAVDALLQLAGGFHLPLLVAHAKACLDDAPSFEARLDDRIWRAGRPERYKLKCLLWLRHELAALPAASLDWLRPLLQAQGCWDALQPDELDAHYQPMAPF